MRGEEAKAAAARAWRSDKKLYLALGAVGAFLLALRLVMRSRAASDFIVHKIVQPYHRAVGWLCGFVPFSVAELCWAVLVLFCIWYVGRTGRAAPCRHSCPKLLLESSAREYGAHECLCQKNSAFKNNLSERAVYF